MFNQGLRVTRLEISPPGPHNLLKFSFIVYEAHDMLVGRHLKRGSILLMLAFGS